METIVKSPEIPGFSTTEKPYMVSRVSVEDLGVNSNEQFATLFNDFIADNIKDDKVLTKIEKNHYKITLSKKKCEELMEEIINELLNSSEGLASTAVWI
jgi:hypothetical protein